MTEVTRTYVDLEDVEAQRARPNFRGVHLYAMLKPEPGEVGSISDGTEPVERIFVREGDGLA